MITVYNLICNNRTKLQPLATSQSSSQKPTTAQTSTQPWKHLQNSTKSAKRWTSATPQSGRAKKATSTTLSRRPPRTFGAGLKLSTKTKWSTSTTSSRVKQRHPQCFQNTKSPLKRGWLFCLMHFANWRVITTFAIAPRWRPNRS